MQLARSAAAVAVEQPDPGAANSATSMLLVIEAVMAAHGLPDITMVADAGRGGMQCAVR